MPQSLIPGFTSYNASRCGTLSTVAPESKRGGPLLSIVIPAYNEEKRLPRYLLEVAAFAESIRGGAEVLIVDDGSYDGTSAYVQAAQANHPCLRIVTLDKNQGKGAAVRRGVCESRGEFVLFADADGATPIAEVLALLAHAEAGAEVVIGSRAAAGSTVNRSRLRRLLGAMFYRLTNLLTVPGVADTQCGFKLFRRVAAQRIFAKVRERGFAFDVEVLFLAQKLGLAIAEVPVQWSAISGSKVRPFRDSIQMATAVLRIRRRGAEIAESVR